MKLIVGISIIVGVLVYTAAIPLLSFADWEGPWKVVAGGWGSGLNQFYLGSKNSINSFPRQFAVTNSEIIIADKGNKRITLYNFDGTLRTIIEKPSKLPNEDDKYGWPQDLEACSKCKSIIISCNYARVSRGIRPSNRCIIDCNGNLQAEVKMGQVFAAEDGFYVLNKGIYYYYSPVGQVIRTDTGKPLELGVINEHSMGDRRYNVVIKYPEHKWTVIGRGRCEEYTRLGNCELYCKGGRQIVRYDAVGHEQGRFTLPEDKQKEIFRGESVEPRIDVVEEYGQPVVAPNGDVYAWKYTKEEYAIIKWVWTDGPDAPMVAAVSSSKGGLRIDWRPPAQNAEEVEGYEVVRSTDVCGPFKPLESVAKNVLQFEDKAVEKVTTYYYQVRAVKKGGYSGYSNKAVGQKK